MFTTVTNPTSAKKMKTRRVAYSPTRALKSNPIPEAEPINVIVMKYAFESGGVALVYSAGLITLRTRELNAARTLINIKTI